VFFLGDAPAMSWDVFFGDSNAVAYYLPGTTGWGSTLEEIPAILWNPQFQTHGPTFGMRTNQFGFMVTGSSNLVVVVEACTDLANPNWVPLSTNALRVGAFYFSNPDGMNFPSRFYRLRPP
jgi:hypothetical protein